MSIEVWGLLLVVGANLAVLAAGWGGIMARLKALEAKMDKHNNLVERLCVVETTVKEMKEREE